MDFDQMHETRPQCSKLTATLPQLCRDLMRESRRDPVLYSIRASVTSYYELLRNLPAACIASASRLAQSSGGFPLSSIFRKTR